MQVRVGPAPKRRPWRQPAELVSKRSGRRRPFDQVPHGKASTYTTWGCRCRPCTDDQVATASAWRRRQRALTKAGVPLPADVDHGSRSAYDTYGCPCEVCAAGQRTRRRARTIAQTPEYRERRRAREREREPYRARYRARHPGAGASGDAH